MMASEVQSVPVENGSSEADRDIWSRPPEQIYQWAVDFYKLGELCRKSGSKVVCLFVRVRACVCVCLSVRLSVYVCMYVCIYVAMYGEPTGERVCVLACAQRRTGCRCGIMTVCSYSHTTSRRSTARTAQTRTTTWGTLMWSAGTDGEGSCGRPSVWFSWLHDTQCWH